MKLVSVFALAVCAGVALAHGNHQDPMGVCREGTVGRRPPCAARQEQGLADSDAAAHLYFAAPWSHHHRIYFAAPWSHRCRYVAHFAGSLAPCAPQVKRQKPEEVLYTEEEQEMLKFLDEPRLDHDIPQSIRARALEDKIQQALEDLMAKETSNANANLKPREPRDRSWQLEDL